MDFDEKGLIVPASEVSIPLAEFEARFVRPFPQTSTRHRIYSSYLNFVERFNAEVSPSFVHWLNGSFVTSKADPNDLDLVTFINDEVYSEKQALIDDEFRLDGARRLFPGLDAYTVRCYPEHNVQGQAVMHMDAMYWRDLFSQTRPNRVGKRFRKGFIEIIYNG